MIYIINKIWLSVAGWILGILYIPNIIKLYKTKDYSQINYNTHLLTIAILGFTFNGYVIFLQTGDIGTLLSQIKSLVPLTIQYVMSLIYYVRRDHYAKYNS